MKSTTWKLGMAVKALAGCALLAAFASSALAADGRISSQLNGTVTIVQTQQEPAALPDAGSTALFLAAGVGGLFLLRRKLAVKGR